MYKKFLQTFACILMVATALPGNPVWAMEEDVEESVESVRAWVRQKMEQFGSGQDPSGTQHNGAVMTWALLPAVSVEHGCGTSAYQFSQQLQSSIKAMQLSPSEEWRCMRHVPSLPRELAERRMKERVDLATRKVEKDIMTMCDQILLGKRNVKRLKFTVETGKYEYNRKARNSSSSYNTSNASNGGGGGEVDVMWGLVKVGGSGGGGSSSSYSSWNNNSVNDIYMKLRPTGLKSLEIEFFKD